MNLHLPELTFEEKRHLYWVDGKNIKSVSHFLKPLSKQIYGEIDKDVLSKAADRGTAVHFAIELYNDLGVLEPPKGDEGYVNAYLEFFKDHDPVVHQSEVRVYHPTYWYAGTCDILGEMNGEPALIDIKTTYALESKLVSLQLSAYAKAFQAHGVDIKKVLALQLKPNGEYVLQEYDIQKSFNMFLHCLAIQNYLGGK